MVDQTKVEQQLRRLGVKISWWGRGEVTELANILTRSEKISQAVYGYYENGLALLVSTDQRLLLVDKKPFNFLNVEDFRFDMINQLDYRHRLFNSSIDISAGPKNLIFTSYNQKSLRELLNCVQCRMIEIKEEKRYASKVQVTGLDRLYQALRKFLGEQIRQAKWPRYPDRELRHSERQFGFEGGSQYVDTAPSFSDKRYLPTNSSGTSLEYIKTGSLLPRPKVDLAAAKIVFAKLPLIRQRRRFQNS